MLEKNDIGIIGYGFVGKILHKYYPEAAIFDINGNYDINEVFKRKVIFISFLNPDNKPEDVEDYAAKAPGGRIFIIKSTFVPGSTDYLQNKYPQHLWVYNPEFLTERTAWKDFTEPQFQILGLPQQSLHLVDDLFNFLPDAPVKRVISPLDAEIYKHAQNSYYALKVTWFNQLYDACRQIGGDYETIKEIMVQNPWIGDSHSIIYHNGYRGYGGKCLSKDPKNFASVVKFPLIEAMEEYNKKLLTNG